MTNTQRLNPTMSHRKRQFSNVLDALRVLQDNFKVSRNLVYRRAKGYAMCGEEFEAIQYLVSRGFKYSHD